MKKFLKNGLIFVFPLLLVLVPLEILLREVPNPYKYKYEWMQKNAPEVETLVLGSHMPFLWHPTGIPRRKGFQPGQCGAGISTGFFPHQLLER